MFALLLFIIDVYSAFNFRSLQLDIQRSNSSIDVSSKYSKGGDVTSRVYPTIAHFVPAATSPEARSLSTGCRGGDTGETDSGV